jgi:hypothetical protein
MYPSPSIHRLAMVDGAACVYHTFTAIRQLILADRVPADAIERFIKRLKISAGSLRPNHHRIVQNGSLAVPATIVGYSQILISLQEKLSNFVFMDARLTKLEVLAAWQTGFYRAIFAPCPINKDTTIGNKRDFLAQLK